MTPLHNTKAYHIDYILLCPNNNWFQHGYKSTKDC